MSLPFFTGFLGLGTGSTAFTEMTGTGYARQAVSFTPLKGGRSQIEFVPDFPGWQTFAAPPTQYGLFDSAGNLLLWWRNVSVSSGASQSSPPGSLVHSVTGITLVIPAVVSEVVTYVVGGGVFFGDVIQTMGALTVMRGQPKRTDLVSGVSVQICARTLNIF